LNFVGFELCRNLYRELYRNPYRELVESTPGGFQAKLLPQTLSFR
jgi:hypothetical protein